LLGLIPYDYDVTTSATPDEMKAVFADFKTHDTGIKHGTITVICDDAAVEVTTFRVDGEYSDCRRPDNVTFTRSLRKDLARRDFTVNAMAYCERTLVIDPFGGRGDLANKLIRAVGDPCERFREDGLRILRALRFAAVYGFEIELQTAIAARRQRTLLQKISAERIMQELNKLICGFGVGSLISEYRDVFGEFIPRIADADLSALDTAPADRITRMALLFAHLGANSAYRTLKDLKCDNETRRGVHPLIEFRNHPPIKPDKIIVKRMLNRFEEDTFFRMASIRNSEEAAQVALQIIEDGECYTLRQFVLKGDTLVAMGYSGHEVGETLNMLLQEHINGQCKNNKDSILSRLKKINPKGKL
jgi:tRNA nucleotidyltransferase (CCA-adding enzyme)